MKTILLATTILLVSCQNSMKTSKSPGISPQAPQERSPAEEPDPEQTEEGEEKIVLELAGEYMEMVNDHRESMGLKKLVYSDEIQLTALNHSRRMARKVIPFGHMGSKLRCRSVLSVLGLERGTLCGENVAVGQETPKEAFDAWMNSPSHREAIEDGRYTHSGLGYYEDFRGKIYWTQIFVQINSASDPQ